MDAGSDNSLGIAGGGQGTTSNGTERGFVDIVERDSGTDSSSSSSESEAGLTCGWDERLLSDVTTMQSDILTLYNFPRN